MTGDPWAWTETFSRTDKPRHDRGPGDIRPDQFEHDDDYAQARDKARWDFADAIYAKTGWPEEGVSS